jgi:hypothetical protein
MKRFDPLSAVYGVFFIIAGIYFADASRRPSFRDLGLAIPVALIVVGLTVIFKNSRKRQ